MRVTILGCGGSAGVPQVGGADGHGDWGACDKAEPRNRRSRSSIVVESHTGQRLLVDTGPDLRTQLLACGIPRIDALLFTHAHADHITGLDEVRILNRISGAPMPTFATEATFGELLRRFDYAFRPWKPPGFFRPVMVPHPFIFGDTIEAAGMPVRVFEQDHYVVKTAGLRIGPFGYSTDVVALDDAAFNALAGIDTWLVGCFQRTPHLTHAHLERVIEWSERVGARRTLLTHMGPDLDWAWRNGGSLPGSSPPATAWCWSFRADPAPLTRSLPFRRFVCLARSIQKGTSGAVFDGHHPGYHLVPAASRARAAGGHISLSSPRALRSV